MMHRYIYNFVALIVAISFSSSLFADPRRSRAVTRGDLQQYLSKRPQKLGSLRVDRDFRYVRTKTDSNNVRHEHYRQEYEREALRIPVHGSYFTVHRKADGSISSVTYTGERRRPPEEFQRPKLTSDQATVIAKKHMGGDIEVFGGPELRFLYYKDEWHLVWWMRVIPKSDPMEARVLFIDANIGSIVRENSLLSYINWYPANSCSSSTTPWPDYPFIELEEDLPTTLSGCSIGNDFVLQDSVRNMATRKGPPLNTPAMYDVFPITLMTEEKFDNLSLFSKKFMYALVQPLWTHLNMQAVLDFMDTYLDLEGFNMKWELSPNVEYSDDHSGGAWTYGDGAIFFNGPEILECKSGEECLAVGTGSSVFIVGHEVFHNVVRKYYDGDNPRYCEYLPPVRRGMEEGMCSAFGSAVLRHYEGENDIYPMQSISTYDDHVADWKNEGPFCGAHYYGSLVELIAQSLMEGVYAQAIDENSDPKELIVAPNSPRIFGYLLTKILTDHYPWEDYAKFSNGLFNVCTDSIGITVPGTAEMISQEYCDDVERVLTVHGLTPANALGVSMDPYFIEVPINLEVKELKFESFKWEIRQPSIEASPMSLIYNLKVKNHGPEPWIYPLEFVTYQPEHGMSAFDEVEYSSEKPINVLYNVYLPVKVRYESYEGLYRPRDIVVNVIKPILEAYYKESKLTVSNVLAADYWISQTFISPQKPVKDKPTEFDILFKVKNTGNRPVWNVLPVEIVGEPPAPPPEADDGDVSDGTVQGGIEGIISGIKGISETGDEPSETDKKEDDESSSKPKDVSRISDRVYQVNSVGMTLDKVMKAIRKAENDKGLFEDLQKGRKDRVGVDKTVSEHVNGKLPKPIVPESKTVDPDEVAGSIVVPAKLELKPSSFSKENLVLPGEEFYVKIKFKTKPGKQLYVSIDPNNLIDELDETNNSVPIVFPEGVEKGLDMIQKEIDADMTKLPKEAEPQGNYWMQNLQRGWQNLHKKLFKEKPPPVPPQQLP